DDARMATGDQEIAPPGRDLDRLDGPTSSFQEPTLQKIEHGALRAGQGGNCDELVQQLDRERGFGRDHEKIIDWPHDETFLYPRAFRPGLGGSCGPPAATDFTPGSPLHGRPDC